MQFKLNPIGLAEIDFPGLQRIKNFTSAGGETSFSVAVNSDIDKEYYIVARNTSPSYTIKLRLNDDANQNYGKQHITLNGYTHVISAGRALTATAIYLVESNLGLSTLNLVVASDFPKMAFSQQGLSLSGSTLMLHALSGTTYTEPENIQTLDFSMYPDGNTFTAGTKIDVYARRSNV